MATRIFDGIKFCEHILKRTSKGKFLSGLDQIGPAVLKKKVFKEIVDDERRTQDHRKSSPWTGCALVSQRIVSYSSYCVKIELIEI